MTKQSESSLYFSICTVCYRCKGIQKLDKKSDFGGLNLRMLVIYVRYNKISTEPKTFTNGPSLVNDFFYGGCVLISSPLHKNRHVVLAVGGTLWPYRTSNAQILDYTQPQASWEKSNYLF